MYKKVLILPILMFTTGCEKKMPLFDITSPKFESFENIPMRYAYKGQNISPPLNIRGVPFLAKSLVLIVDDIDAPTDSWIHWILYNIPTNTSTIEENSVPAGASEGVNSWGNKGYGGPSPPSGVHRYFFKLYALNIKLNLVNPEKKEIEKAIQGHVVAKAELVGLYGKTANFSKSLNNNFSIDL